VAGANHQTVSLYIKGLRLERPRRDLLDPRLAGRPISAIAYGCGFGDQRVQPSLQGGLRSQPERTAERLNLHVATVGAGGPSRSGSQPLWHSGRSAPYPGRVFSIRVKQPRSTAARCWNVAQNVLSPVVLFTFIVLKLTGVTDWSWWWVLSPLWISGILVVLVVLGVGALLVGSRWHTRRQARLWADQLGSEWFRDFVAGKAPSGGDRGLQDGDGQAPTRSDGLGRGASGRPSRRITHFT
jgi:hypothetical protein